MADAGRKNHTTQASSRTQKTETFTPTLHMRSLFTLIIPYVFIVCGNDIFSFWLPHFYNQRISNPI